MSALLSVVDRFGKRWRSLERDFHSPPDVSSKGCVIDVVFRPRNLDRLKLPVEVDHHQIPSSRLLESIDRFSVLPPEMQKLLAKKIIDALDEIGFEHD